MCAQAWRIKKSHKSKKRIVKTPFVWNPQIRIWVIPESRGQKELVRLAMLLQGKSSMTVQQIPVPQQRGKLDGIRQPSQHSYFINPRAETITNFRPEASAAALTHPRRWTFDANWVKMTRRPFAAVILRIRASATSASLVVLPGDNTFVESLIICKYKMQVSPFASTKIAWATLSPLQYKGLFKNYAITLNCPISVGHSTSLEPP